MTDEQRRESPDQNREARVAPARIALIYESDDRRFCLFEDSEGHITAVRASRLA